MTHPVDNFVGQRIRHRRWMVGMTQQDLAEEVGIKFGVDGMDMDTRDGFL